MTWLYAQTWLLLLTAFVLGSAAAWLLHHLLGRRADRPEVRTDA